MNKNIFNKLKIGIASLFALFLLSFTYLTLDNRICFDDMSYTSDLDYVFFAYHGLFPKTNHDVYYVHDVTRVVGSGNRKVLAHGLNVSLDARYRIDISLKNRPDMPILILENIFVIDLFYSRMGKILYISHESRGDNHILYSSCGEPLHAY